MSEDFVTLDPDDQLGYLLVRAADRVSRAWLAALREHGINPRQFSMLAVLAREPGLSQGELARRVMITPQSVSESVVALLDGGFVTRRDAEPGRAAQLQLTTRGRRLLTKAYPVVEASNHQGFSTLTRAEQAALARLLHKVIAGTA